MSTPVTPVTPERLAEVLAAHKQWLTGEGGVRADLRGADLSGADLSGADLRGANLRWTDLREADLRRTDLRWTDLRWADLSGADLRGANLRWTDLREANLRWTDLRRADLRGANLREANLSGANLSCTGVVVLVGPWSGWVDPEQATIGCQQHPHAFWRSLTKAQTDRMGSGAWEQWQAWGPVVLAAIDCAARHGWPKSEEPAAAVSLEPEPAVSTTTTDA